MSNPGARDDSAPHTPDVEGRICVGRDAGHSPPDAAETLHSTGIRPSRRTDEINHALEAS